MLNKNGKTLLYPTKTLQGTIKAVDGVTRDVNLSSYANDILCDTKAKIVLGSGNNDPTLNDYCIEDEIEGLTVISSVIPNRDSSGTLPYDNNYILSATLTVKNNTNNPIVVKEVGYYAYFDSSCWGDNKYYMVARDVITPVTIAVGKTYTFSMTIG